MNEENNIALINEELKLDTYKTEDIKNLIYTSTIDQAQTDGYKLSYSAVLDYILRSISGDAVFTKVTGEKFSLLFPAFGAFAFPWIKEIGRAHV